MQSLSEYSIYCILIFYRSSHLRCFIEISLNSQENTCSRVSFLVKLQALGVFLWTLRNFWEHIFYRTPPDDCLWFFTIHPFNMSKSVFSSTQCTLHAWRFLLIGSKKLWCSFRLLCIWFLKLNQQDTGVNSSRIQ